MSQNFKNSDKEKMNQESFASSLGKVAEKWKKLSEKLKPSHENSLTNKNQNKDIEKESQKSEEFIVVVEQKASDFNPLDLNAERLELERLESERLESERLELERLELERLESERLESERLESERLESERLESERLESERLELERLELERLELERLESEKLSIDLIIPVAPVILEKPIQVSKEEKIEEKSQVQSMDLLISEINKIAEPMIEDKLDEDMDFWAVFVEEVDVYMPQVRIDFEALGKGELGVVSNLYRSLHTLKGSIGQVGAYRARGLFHVLESMIEEIQARPSQKAVDDKFPIMQVIWDAASTLVDGLREHKNVPIPSLPKEAFDELPQGLQKTILVEKTNKQEEVVEEKAMVEQMVRVRASAVDHLLNQSNELKLARSGLKNGLDEISMYMKDLDENGERLAHMLREIEIHADSQIQARRLEMEASSETFDPLEFDRFTRLQELARFMAEGLNDISQIRQGLQRISSEQENRLAQQDRALEEIQEGLGKTRLTSIGKFLEEGLARTARQTSVEVGKPIDFELLGGNIEVDRVLLEKLGGPLSHILRNSLTHGIEEASKREAAGKPATGKIIIQFKLESGRLRITCTDDGAGLNLNAIRNKAIKQGLWKSTESMTVRQAADIICTPSFSTAENVSELAGRGVGMDVVRTSILELGGRFNIDSVEGKGLIVSMLIPTSLSNIVSLVVLAGNQRWSFPTESVVQVQVLRGDELKKARQDGEWKDSEGQLWPYVSLVERLGLHQGFNLSQKNAFVITIQEKEQRIAIEVDKIQAVQELPLRPLGRAWARLPGVLGSTLMPDGEAIFLIDILRLPLLNVKLKTNEISKEHRLKNILVVDDSLTVRRHCERLLSENGYHPILVKDGREALDYLTSEEGLVDLVLLDVEMPKMDGFELTRQIRSDAKLKHLPLIMITSRTAEKHRNYGLQLGVNDYMGKPIKDEELLLAIQKWG